MDRKEAKRVLKNWKNVNREMARDAAQFPATMREIPRHMWPAKAQDHDPDLKPVSVWRSNKFFAQVVREKNGALRISVNRTRIQEDFNFEDKITWDELFAIKNQIGFADFDCVEIYPAKSDLVNVANVRHLFVLDEPHPYNWGNQRRK